MNTIFLASLIHLICVVLGLEPEGSTTVGSYRLELYDGGGKSHQAAKAECESRDSWLVEIKDAEIDRAVQDITSSYHVWVGLFYDSGWKWNDGSQLRYEKWKNNRRPQIYGLSPKCGLRESSGFWRNYDCDSGHRYVCQSDISYPGPFFITITKSANINFKGAKAACESDGSRLVDVKTSVLSNFILERIRGDSSNYWTGGNDLLRTRVFKWGDGTVIDDNDHRWFKGQWHEPNNNLLEANCVAVSSALMGWADIRCSAPARYICQKDVTTGTCDGDICSNRGTCQYANPRYKCTCTAKYFGTKCEKNLIQISAEEPTVTVKRGESLQAALNVISFDGNVRISRWVSGSQLGQREVTIQRAGTSVKVPYLLGTQVEAKTYTFVAKPSTNIYSYSASTSVTVTVTSRCTTSLCSNGGTCEDKDEPPYYQCRCTGTYEGDHCEERKYLLRGNCKYHVNYEKWRVFSDANSNCQDLGGALVMIKSLDLQDALEEQFIRQYGNSGNAEIWVGGYKTNNIWYWVDGTKIPTTGSNQKWEQKTQTYMIISAYLRTRDDMYWYGKNRYQTVGGYICEVPVLGRDPCTGVRCANGGKCVPVGCQANCDCKVGFDGVRCENDRITITPLRTSYTVEQGKTVSVKLRIHSNDGRVNVLMSNSISSPPLSKNGVSDGTVITFTIGPFKDQTPKTTYTIVATPQSSPGTYFKYAYVDIGVEGPPSIPEIYPETFTIPPTQSQEAIACTATGFPTPTITWKRGDLDVPRDTSLNAFQVESSGKSTMYFSNHAKTEVGYYTCFAENIVGGKNKSTNETAFVRGKIGLIKSIAKITDSSFQLTTISCTFEGYPNFDIRWKFGSSTNKFESIPSNEDGSIFSVKDERVDTEFTPLVRKMSTLTITLTEYLGPTIVSCFAGNKYENTTTNKNTTFKINQNLVLEGNRSYRIYEKSEDKRNFSATVSYCEAVDREPVKIYDNATLTLLTEELSRRNLRSVFIAAQRQFEDDVKLWKWNDGSIFYNETKHGPSMYSESKIVDGQFVAWYQSEPSGTKKDCARLTFENVWAWFGAKCKILLNPICESHVAGVPKNLMTTVKKCTAHLTVTWSTNKPAIGVRHRLEIRKTSVYQSKPEKTKKITPTDGEEIMKSFRNLELDTKYNVTFIVCPQCPIPFRTSRIVSTYAIVPAENRSVETANVTRVGKSCMVSWSVAITKGIIGFKVTAESTFAHLASRKYSNLGSGVEERNTTHRVRLGHFPTIPNRRYTFGVQTLTCQGLGQSVQATGNCVSDSAPPSSVPKSNVISEPNEDGTMTIDISIPDESNGPISCIFVVVIYEPDSADETKEYSRNDLTEAMRKSTATKMMPNDAYIAIAIKRSVITSRDHSSEQLKMNLGDESVSECDPDQLETERRRRETSSESTIKASNRQLEDGAEYRYFTVTTTPGEMEVYVIRSEAETFTKPIAPTSVGLIVGIVVAIILICVLIAAGIFFYIKRWKNKKEVTPAVNLNEIQENVEHVYANLAINAREPRSETDIPLGQLLAKYESLRAEDGRKFREEFQKLKEEAKKLEYPTVAGSKIDLNISKEERKNRFKNILPSDHTRVVLSGDENSSYINACFIHGFSKPRKFIATQGPLRSTVNDFWRMIVEQKCTVIAMLTNCNENGKVKCQKYWPAMGSSQNFGEIVVENTREETFGGFKISTLNVTIANQTTIQVAHFHFVSWPDHGVPVSTTNLIRYHQAVMELRSEAPIVIHCSAGAGRTGAFIGYDFLLGEVGTLASVDVYNCVMKMREQRIEMVQICDQYILIHKLILEKHLFGETDLSTQKIMEVLNNESTLRKEFDNLSVTGPISQLKHGNTEYTAHHNRNPEIVPYERNKVVVMMTRNETGIPYINASVLEAYDPATRMIAAQGPLQITVEYFWRTIFGGNVNTIVMLTQCIEKQKEQSVQYWPTEENNAMAINDITIRFISENQLGNIITREFQATREKEGRTIIQYQYIGWGVDKCPQNPTEVLELVEKMHSSMRRNKAGAAIVHCSDGAGRTGAFCAIVNLIERLKCENKADVFRAVKDLRDCRPGMVQTLDQYRFCYEAVSTYLSSFNLYSNFQGGASDNIYQNV